MTGFLVTHDFGYSPSKPDEAARWAYWHERGLRELRYRVAFPEDVPAEVSLAEVVPARDAGDMCGVCGEIVTWVDHLPPTLSSGESVRCYANVGFLPPHSVKV